VNPRHPHSHAARTAQPSPRWLLSRVLLALTLVALPGGPATSLARQTIRVQFPLFGADPTEAAAAADQFALLLSQETGLDVRASVFPCLQGVVEHLATGRTDLAPLTQFEYIFGHDTYGIEALLVNLQYDAPDYRSQINVSAGRGYADIWDLQGTRFASPDPASTSSYLLPYLLILETTGMTLTEFFSEVLFTGSHKQVIRDVYAGTADCGATWEDARSAVVDDHPDVYDVVTVLTYTDFMPNHPWAIRSGLNQSLVQTLSDGVISVARTAAGQSALEPFFGPYLTGIATTTDDTYDVVRRFADALDEQPQPCPRIYLPVVL